MNIRNSNKQIQKDPYTFRSLQFFEDYARNKRVKTSQWESWDHWITNTSTSETLILYNATFGRVYIHRNQRKFEEVRNTIQPKVSQKIPSRGMHSFTINLRIEASVRTSMTVSRTRVLKSYCKWKELKYGSTTLAIFSS